mmetsp:Transcript_21031/g.41692  ORF Transcript_21031/g.41692 Transcript_21031/m.41692 type:complete len:173 (-) Transcript_21031:46-564(-)|eukprot:CAMPEP_0175139366 /NCGR_PEP_ID=MMETSP0087-20121206/10860_1 /TAXON_ID=136419 /ORGANISM="Unknown Unknown, Strain D1" /LENGTH=172 /DNA_ID=CAMNT_0016422363 /DNA_START=32 /DNA_END=550 /DNA_ORIENTATION=+
MRLLVASICFFAVANAIAVVPIPGGPRREPFRLAAVKRSAARGSGPAASGPEGPIVPDPRVLANVDLLYARTREQIQKEFDDERKLGEYWHTEHDKRQKQFQQVENSLWHALQHEQDERKAADAAGIASFEAVTDTAQTEISRLNAELGDLDSLLNKVSSQNQQTQSAAGRR